MRDLSIQRPCLFGRLESKPVERDPEPVELLERRRAVAGIRVHPHQRTVRRLVGRLLGDDLLPQSGSTKELEMESAQMSATLSSPVLVPLVREQLAAIGGSDGRALLGRARSQRGLAFVLKALGIDDEVGVRPEGDLILVKGDRVLRPERRSRVVSGLPKIRRARLGCEARPEGVDDLLAVQLVPRRKREQLHEVGRTAVLPRAGRHEASVDRDLEAAQNADLDASHAGRMQPLAPASKTASSMRPPR